MPQCLHKYSSTLSQGILPEKVPLRPIPFENTQTYIKLIFLYLNIGLIKFFKLSLYMLVLMNGFICMYIYFVFVLHVLQVLNLFDHQSIFFNGIN